MKKTIHYKEYDGETIVDAYRDFTEALDDNYNEILNEVPQNEYALYKGKFRVSIIWCSEDDCDCKGFQHKSDCPHWVMCY